MAAGEPPPPPPPRAGEALPAISSLPYPERFHAAAETAGVAGAGAQQQQPGSAAAPATPAFAFSNEAALLLYALHQQATVGPCKTAKPWGWNVVDSAKWTSWKNLGQMAPMEAMRLFVRTLEEEQPDWWSKYQAKHEEGQGAEEAVAAPIPEPAPVIELAASNGTTKLDDDVFVAEGLEAVNVYNQWISPFVTCKRPAPRYQHAAAVVGHRMYVVGGNCRGKFLADTMMLDLDTMLWSKVENRADSAAPLPPIAGLSLVRWGKELLALGGHSKEAEQAFRVRSLDLDSHVWSTLEVKGPVPCARRGHTATVMGSTVLVFGGEDSRRRLLNDVHLLDLETLTWEALDTVGAAPSPRCDHAAAAFSGRYLFVYGGGSPAHCYRDLHVLDLETQQWSAPHAQGMVPAARAGHASATIGDRWFIVGGGDNRTGISDTLVLDMSTLVWSVAGTAPSKTSIASEGLSVVVGPERGGCLLVFGGYNGRYSDEVHVFKPAPVLEPQRSIIQSAAAAAAAAAVASASAAAPLRSEQAAPARPLPSATSATGELVQQKETEKPAVGAGNPEARGGARVREPAEGPSSPKRSVEAAVGPPGSGAKPQAASPEPRQNFQELEDLRKRLQAAEASKAAAVEAASGAQADVAALKREVAAARAAFSDMEQELQSQRAALAAEQSRSFKLEVDVAELVAKLQVMEALENEVQVLRKQRAASEAQMAHAAQEQQKGGVWNWLAPSPPPKQGT